MFSNRHNDRSNIAGIKVARIRKALRISQRELSDRFQLIGLDVDKDFNPITATKDKYSDLLVLQSIAKNGQAS